ncbi:hypothetical protein BJ741DRAFT_712135 [Chytriomyces cf. hyalinus JEL632]|nr:hypothetical protein BJ741DRAFT_712135 [Chytriomyces cf. hyalinus JEL632]
MESTESEQQLRLEQLLGQQFEFDFEEELDVDNNASNLQAEDSNGQAEEAGRDSHSFRLFDSQLAQVSIVETDPTDSYTAVERVYEVDSDEEEMKRSKFESGGVIVSAATVLLGESVSTQDDIWSRRITHIPITLKKPHNQLRKSKKQRLQLRTKKSMQTKTAADIERYNAAEPVSLKSSLPILNRQYFKQPAVALSIHKQRFSYWLGGARVVKGERGAPASFYGFNGGGGRGSVGRGRGGFGGGSGFGRGASSSYSRGGGGGASFGRDRGRGGFSRGGFKSSSTGFGNRGGFAANKPHGSQASVLKASDGASSSGTGAQISGGNGGASKFKNLQ